MKPILRALLRLHLRRPLGLWVGAALATLFLGFGVLRVERRLDLFSLLPTNHPVVRASLEAGVGRQELLWLAAEGSPEDLEAREAWAEQLAGRLMDGVPLNGMSGEGRLSAPLAVPGPGGASLWPPLLAAGSLVDGDAVVERLLTEQFYALAPVLLGDRLTALNSSEELQRRFRQTAAALAGIDPVQARFATLDPLRLRELLPAEDPAAERAMRAGRAFPLRLRTGFLTTKDAKFVLFPVVLQFPSGDSAATAAVIGWLAGGAEGPLPDRVGHSELVRALERTARRPFAIQVTGAHAIAYWESQRLGREVLGSFLLSFLLIGLVYWVGFRTLAGYGFVVLPLLVGIFWSLGLVGWVLGQLNLMAAAFGAVLLGIGDDVGILLFSRYREERRAGRTKAFALRAALLGTGPGVAAGALATAAAFLACAAAPFPGFRDLGLTAGLGLLACACATFLLMPALLLAFDKGTGVFAPAAESGTRPRASRVNLKAAAALAAVLLFAVGASRVRWEEDLRRFRVTGNPALALQENLGRLIGAGLQPLALELPLADPDRLPQRWNRIAEPLRREGLPWPDWKTMDPELRLALASQTWRQGALAAAAAAGLDPAALERPFAAFQASVEDPMEAVRSLQNLVSAPSRSTDQGRWTLLSALHREGDKAKEPASRLLLPIRLSEASQDRVAAEVEAAGGRLVGTRPLFQAVKEAARSALRLSIGWALAGVLAVVVLFGRRPRFVGLAVPPLSAGIAGVLGSLGWSGEPLTFLSLVAIPITLGVSVDVAMNLLHRARMEPDAVRAVARVNAVCAGTTLAGFGGLAFSSYRGLRGLGVACLGGVALALLVTQWLLPWALRRWPVLSGRHE